MSRWLWPMGAMTLGLLACAEATDCRRTPQLCVRGTSRTVEAAPLAPTPVQIAPPRPERGPRPAAGLRPLPVVPPNVAPPAPPPRAEVPDRARVLGVLPAGLAQETPEQKAARTVVNQLAPSAKAHDFKGLQGHMSKRLAADLGGKIAQYEARLWRHLDRYASAVDKGFQVSVTTEGADRMQVTLTTGDGDELKPILAREDGRWTVDRF